MAELLEIETGPGLIFDVLAEGAADAPFVLLLHGFAESFHMWRAQLPALASAGYRALAPSQRGYSGRARPGATDVANYRFDLLLSDAMALAARCGHAGGRFHVVGHDWGAGIAWGIADRYPERVASLTVLSRPHPNAFNRALHLPDGEQARRSRHHQAFLEPDAAARVLENDARWLRERWSKSGVSDEAAAQYLSVLGNEPAMTAALAWYRARWRHARAARSDLGAGALCLGRSRRHGRAHCRQRHAATSCSGPYRFESLPGVGAFRRRPGAGATTTRSLLAHLAAYPA